MQAGEEDSGAFLKFSKTMTFSRKKYSQGGANGAPAPSIQDMGASKEWN